MNDAMSQGNFVAFSALQKTIVSFFSPIGLFKNCVGGFSLKLHESLIKVSVVPTTMNCMSFPPSQTKLRDASDSIIEVHFYVCNTSNCAVVYCILMQVLMDYRLILYSIPIKSRLL